MGDGENLSAAPSRVPPFVRKVHVVVAACAFLLAGTVAQAGADHATNVERLLLNEINRVRIAKGLPTLGADAQLRLAARAHSRDVLRRGVLTHGSVGRRLQSYGVRSKPIGEVIAWSAGRPVRARFIVAQWLASPPHRAILLSRHFHRVGVGSAAGPFMGFRTADVLTADFAR